MSRYLGAVSDAGQACQLLRSSYCKSPVEISSSVSFGLKSEIRSAILRQVSSEAMADRRFSW